MEKTSMTPEVSIINNAKKTDAIHRLFRVGTLALVTIGVLATNVRDRASSVYAAFFDPNPGQHDTTNIPLHPVSESIATKSDVLAVPANVGYGAVDFSGRNAEYRTHALANRLTDTRHGTVVVFPDRSWGGAGWGAFVAPIGTPDRVNYSSFYTDPAFLNNGPERHNAVETMFFSDQATLDRTGKMVIAIGTTNGRPPDLYVSENGGVDWRRTDKFIREAIDPKLSDPYAPQRAEFQNYVREILP